MTINDEILIIANQLANQGKKPSVALVKTRLSQPVPLPKIIAVLKTWQHQPEFVSVTPSTEKEEIHHQEFQNVNIEEIIEHAIAPLKKEISALKAEIEQLKNSK